MIHTTNLSKNFGNILAVDNLSISVDEGEVFGFLGPNGAGKTTTIRLLTSLISPTNGSAIVNGYVLGENDQAIRRTVGILTETPGFYENLTAERNLLIFASLYEVDQLKRQVNKYLDMLGLWQRRGDEVGTFSKGMKQRLAIARVLLHEPKIVFLDEPTSGLDPEAAHMVREFIKNLKSQKRTIFLCTHNLDEADRLCDRIAVFKTRLLVVDTPNRLRKELYGRQIVIHLVESIPGVVKKIAEFPFVEQVEMIDNKLLVRVHDPEQNNPEIIKTLVSTGAQIQFVGELRRSLEDVYLQLVTQQ